MDNNVSLTIFMDSNRLWELLGKRISGEVDPQELVELKELLRQFPEALYSTEIIEQYWAASGKSEEEAGRENSLARLMERIETKDDVPQVVDERPIDKIQTGGWYRRMRRIAIAAAMITFVAVGVKYFFAGKKNKRVEKPIVKTLIATKGNKNHFSLPDGSKLWLNAGTTISYNEDIDTNTVRKVFLSGEAFFEIHHDEKRPFLIETTHMEIRDIGTSFNVKAYPSDKTTEATLIEGSIEVKMKNNNQSAILSLPNEKITVFNRQPPSTADTSTHRQKKPNDKSSFVVSTAVQHKEDYYLAETAWMNDMLLFQNKSFEELASEMERWYDVVMIFETEELKKIRFTGAFANETIAQALSELQLMRSFHFTTDGRTIRLAK